MFLLRVAPYPRSILGLPLKCTCYVLTDGPAGGCRDGKSAPNGTGPNAHKVHGHVLTQTDQADPNMLTFIVHPTDERVQLSAQGKFKVVSLCIYYFIHLSILHTHTHVHTHICTPTYANTHMESYISQPFHIFSKTKIFPILIPKSPDQVLSMSSLSCQIRITRKYCIQFY